MINRSEADESNRASLLAPASSIAVTGDGTNAARGDSQIVDEIDSLTNWEAQQQLALTRQVVRDGTRRLWTIGLVPFALFLPFIILRMLLTSNSWIWLVTNPIFIFSVTCLFISATIRLIRPGRRARRAALTLTRAVEAPNIGSLIDTMTFHVGMPSADEAIDILTVLLNDLSDTDRIQLTGKRLEALHHKLAQHAWSSGDLLQNPSIRRDRHVRLQIAILNALEVVGSEGSVMHVQNAIRYGNTPAVKAAAEHCLPVLEERAAAERAGKTLLRPSSADLVADQILLRPASTSNVIETSVLVRPVEMPGASLNPDLPDTEVSKVSVANSED